MELNLELLQQLPAEDEAEDGLCYVTCIVSCMSTAPIELCKATGFIT